MTLDQLDHICKILKNGEAINFHRDDLLPLFPDVDFAIKIILNLSDDEFEYPLQRMQSWLEKRGIRAYESMTKPEFQLRRIA